MLSEALIILVMVSRANKKNMIGMYSPCLFNLLFCVHQIRKQAITFLGLGKKLNTSHGKENFYSTKTWHYLLSYKTKSNKETAAIGKLFYHFTEQKFPLDVTKVIRKIRLILFYTI